MAMFKFVERIVTLAGPCVLAVSPVIWLLEVGRGICMGRTLSTSATAIVLKFNNKYLQVLEDAGLKIAGYSADHSLVEMIEIPDHPWFVACQFHPEFTSHSPETDIRCSAGLFGLQLVIRKAIDVVKNSCCRRFANCQ